eukprot:COSAG02_NODE_8442_length_2569_cov_1.587854_4_plen_94_part_00
MVKMAKTQSDEQFNAEIHAIGLYLDAAIIFLNLCRLFAGAGGGTYVTYNIMTKSEYDVDALLLCQCPHRAAAMTCESVARCWLTYSDTNCGGV